MNSRCAFWLLPCFLVVPWPAQASESGIVESRLIEEPKIPARKSDLPANILQPLTQLTSDRLLPPLLALDDLERQKLLNANSALLSTELSPIQRVNGRTIGLLSAVPLKEGELLTTGIARFFSPIRSSRGSANDDLNLNQSYSLAYGLKDTIELGVDLQGQNTTTPGAQQNYIVQRVESNGQGANVIQEATVYAKFRFFHQDTLQASAILSSTFGSRVFTFSGPANFTSRSSGFTPALEIPLTYTAWQGALSFTLSPRLAFFSTDNAVFYPINPQLGGNFGTTLGIALGGTVQLGPRLQLRGDVMPIVFGNNTIETNSGLPSRRIVFNAGMRYLVNPRLAIDLFASNAIGNTGAAAFAARPDIGFGVGLTYVPDRIWPLEFNANRGFAKSFNTNLSEESQFVRSGIGFLDGGTIPEGQFFTQLRISNLGVATSLRLGLLNDFEVGLFANFTASTVDESEAGLSIKLRLLNQASNNPFTLSTVLTLGRTSARFTNFLNQDPNAILSAQNQFGAGIGDRGPLPPNLFQTERAGEAFIGTLSFPLQQTNPDVSWWVTPKVIFIQRTPDNLSPIVGLSVGSSVRLGSHLEAFAELSPLLRGENALIGNRRERVLPWSIGLRWVPNLEALPTSLELFVTNSLGFSPLQSLRVIHDNGISVGLGLNFGFNALR